MGKEPLNIIKVNIKRISINDYLINEVHVDLTHINYGINSKKGEYNEKKRSDYKIDDVLALLNQMDGEYFVPDGEDEDCCYFSAEKVKDGKIYKIVFWVGKVKNNVLGVITMFKSRSANKR